MVVIYNLNIICMRVSIGIRVGIQYQTMLINIIQIIAVNKHQQLSTIYIIIYRYLWQNNVQTIQIVSALMRTASITSDHYNNDQNHNNNNNNKLNPNNCHINTNTNTNNCYSQQQNKQTQQLNSPIKRPARLRKGSAQYYQINSMPITKTNPSNTYKQLQQFNCSSTPVRPINTTPPNNPPTIIRDLNMNIWHTHGLKIGSGVTKFAIKNKDIILITHQNLTHLGQLATTHPSIKNILINQKICTQDMLDLWIYKYLNNFDTSQQKDKYRCNNRLEYWSRHVRKYNGSCVVGHLYILENYCSVISGVGVNGNGVGGCGSKIMDKKSSIGIGIGMDSNSKQKQIIKEKNTLNPSSSSPSKKRSKIITKLKLYNFQQSDEQQYQIIQHITKNSQLQSQLQLQKIQRIQKIQNITVVRLEQFQNQYIIMLELSPQAQAQVGQNIDRDTVKNKQRLQRIVDHLLTEYLNNINKQHNHNHNHNNNNNSNKIDQINQKMKRTDSTNWTNNNNNNNINKSIVNQLPSYSKYKLHKSISLKQISLVKYQSNRKLQSFKQKISKQSYNLGNDGNRNGQINNNISAETQQNMNKNKKMKNINRQITQISQQKLSRIIQTRQDDPNKSNVSIVQNQIKQKPRCSVRRKQTQKLLSVDLPKQMMIQPFKKQKKSSSFKEVLAMFCCKSSSLQKKDTRTTNQAQENSP